MESSVESYPQNLPAIHGNEEVSGVVSSKPKSPVLEIGTPGSVGWGLPLGGSYTPQRNKWPTL